MSRLTKDICDLMGVPHTRGSEQLDPRDLKCPRMVLAGGSGFLGRLLQKHFLNQGWQVVVLTREKNHINQKNQRLVQVLWDGRTTGVWARWMEGAKAVVNLCGVSVNCRYNEANRKRILDSRLLPTAALGNAIKDCVNPPEVWLNASTATIYEHSMDRDQNEETGTYEANEMAKEESSIEVAQKWEAAADQFDLPHTRLIHMRTGMVLSALKDDNSVFGVFRRLTRMGLGGAMGNGNQYVSWIHEDDFCRAVDCLIKNENLKGPMNLTAPRPVPNQEMMKTFREKLGIPFGMPAPKWALEVGAFFMRTETELIIKSRRVVPHRLTEAGFIFEFPQIEQAIENLETQTIDARAKKVHPLKRVSATFS